MLQNATPNEIGPFVERRWEAMARIGDWDRIREHMLQSRDPVRNHSEVHWLYLVSEVRRWLGWARPENGALRLSRYLADEFRSLEPLPLNNPS